MLTVAALEVIDVPLLVGVLAIHRHGRVQNRRPALMVSAWCPNCRGRHCATWPDDGLALDAVLVVDAPCRRGLFQGLQIAVGLDPDQAAVHRKTLRHHKERLRRFLVEARLANRLAAERSRERAHCRAWPDASGRSV